MPDWISRVLDKPSMFLLFAIVVVVVGGPTFVGRLADVYLPKASDQQVIKDIDLVEKRSNKINDVLVYQKRILEAITELARALDEARAERVDLQVRMSSMETWRYLNRFTPIPDSFDRNP